VEGFSRDVVVFVLAVDEELRFVAALSILSREAGQIEQTSDAVGLFAEEVVGALEFGEVLACKGDGLRAWE
jgi:hypothetical protein